MCTQSIPCVGSSANIHYTSPLFNTQGCRCHLSNTIEFDIKYSLPTPRDSPRSSIDEKEFKAIFGKHNKMCEK